MPHSEAHPEPWPDTPWVIRKRNVRLKHEAPETIDFYRCQYPNGLEVTAMRQGALYGLKRGQGATFSLETDAEGIHHGVLHMHLVPGQPADGEVSCQAGKYENNRELAYNRDAYRMWKFQNPGQEPELNVLWSEWSNSQPLGVVEPDPVPEPGLLLMLAIGILGLTVAGWRRKTP